MANSTTPNSNQIRLVLHEEKTLYSIGEPIRPKLQILNNTARKIEFGYGFIFDWAELAFAEPNFIHLIGPDGAELALPYRRDKSYFNSINLIILDEGKAEWLYLPIYAHFHLRKPGDYTFWLELIDSFGEVHQSKRISFRLVDVEASVPPEVVELTLQSKKSSLGVEESIDVEAVFTNKFSKSLIFLRPQEDSFSGWVNPVCQFTVIDRTGRSLALALRCGTMAIPVYNDTTKVIIEPGESCWQKLRLPVFPKMRMPGSYRVRLSYIVREKAIGKGGVVLDKQMNWEKEVFIGRIESNELTITIT